MAYAGELAEKLAQVVFYLIPLLFCAVISYVIYQLYFHPLAKYPGPLLGRLSNLYGGYQSWKGQFHEDVRRCHEKYGNVIRYAPNRILFNSTQGFKDIYNHKSNVVKSKVYDQMVHRAPNILTLRDKSQHGVRRRIMSHGFSENALRGFEPLVLEQIHKFCDLISPQNQHESDNQWSPARNISRWCDYLAFDIMTSVIFSSGYNMLENPRDRNVIQSIEDSNVRVSVLLQSAELRFWRLDKKLFPKAIKARNIFIKFAAKLLKDRMSFDFQPNSTTKDIFSLLQKAKDPETGKGFREAELGAETVTLIVAGTDTTSTTMAAMMFYLSRNPCVYRAVTKEVRETFSSAEEVRVGTKLNSCTYLRSCIDETLRISPPAGGVLWREVQSGGAVIDCQHFPAGVDVGVGIYSLHHNPEYYPEPKRFRPERWQRHEKGDDSQPTSLPYSPFSVGPRSCIGKSLALMELMLMMATVLYLFDFRDEKVPSFDSGDSEDCPPEEFRLHDHITAAKDGPMLQFRRR